MEYARRDSHARGALFAMTLARLFRNTSALGEGTNQSSRRARHSKSVVPLALRAAAALLAAPHKTQKAGGSRTPDYHRSRGRSIPLMISYACRMPETPRSAGLTLGCCLRPTGWS